VFYALEVVYAARERLGRLPTEEDLVALQEAKVTTHKPTDKLLRYARSVAGLI